MNSMTMALSFGGKVTSAALYNRSSLDITKKSQPPSSSAAVPPTNNICYFTFALSSTTCIPLRRRTSSISCQVALKSNHSSPSSSSSESEEFNRIGARVRVKVPLKVYHVPRVPEVDLTGMEGRLKQYIALWKGKRISANLPFKVEFLLDVQGRGPVKFFAHLKEDEFEYLDSS